MRAISGPTSSRATLAMSVRSPEAVSRNTRTVVAIWPVPTGSVRSERISAEPDVAARAAASQSGVRCSTPATTAGVGPGEVDVTASSPLGQEVEDLGEGGGVLEHEDVAP